MVFDLPVNRVPCGGGDLDEKLLGAGFRDGDLGDFPLALLLGEDESLLGSHGAEEVEKRRWEEGVQSIWEC